MKCYGARWAMSKLQNIQLQERLRNLEFTVYRKEGNAFKEEKKKMMLPARWGA
jgi:hypothetical protein